MRSPLVMGRQLLTVCATAHLVNSMLIPTANHEAPCVTLGSNSSYEELGHFNRRLLIDWKTLGHQYQKPSSDLWEALLYNTGP